MRTSFSCLAFIILAACGGSSDPLTIVDYRYGDDGVTHSNIQITDDGQVTFDNEGLGSFDNGTIPADDAALEQLETAILAVDNPMLASRTLGDAGAHPLVGTLTIRIDDKDVVAREIVAEEGKLVDRSIPQAEAILAVVYKFATVRMPE